MTKWTLSSQLHFLNNSSSNRFQYRFRMYMWAVYIGETTRHLERRIRQDILGRPVHSKITLHHHLRLVIFILFVKASKILSELKLFSLICAKSSKKLSFEIWEGAVIADVWGIEKRRAYWKHRCISVSSDWPSSVWIGPFSNFEWLFQWP